MKKIFLCIIIGGAVLASCKKTKPSNGNPSATPVPTAAPLNRPDLNAVCNRIGDGRGGGTCTKETTAKFAIGVVASVLQVPQSYLTASALPRVPKEYIGEIYRRLEGFGLCGVFDGSELMVRDGSDYSEFYTIATPIEYRRKIHHSKTCNKAPQYARWDEMTFNVVLPQCHLPPSVFDESNPSHQCTSRSDGATLFYVDDVNQAIDKVIAEERVNPTGMLDFNDPWDSVFNIRITGERENITRYLQRVSGHLRAKGYCAYEFSEGLSLKKDSNTFSEFYDLIFDRTQNGVAKRWVQRTPHSRCTPAEF